MPRTNRVAYVVAVLAALLAMHCLPLSAAEQDPSLAERARAMALPIIESETASGVAIGLLIAADPAAPQRVAFGLGVSKDESQAPCTPATLFEIGSVTKTFTGILLADMALRGEVALDDPAQKFLPEDVRMPVHGEQPIRLKHLASHSSGLPRLPNNMKPAVPTNPYVDYDAARLHDFLTKYKLRYAPDERTAYSNLGAGMLGYLLERAAGKPYEQLIQERICTPLGMAHTVVTLNEEHQRVMAQGHDADGNPVSTWEFDTMLAAGGLRSNVDDLLTYIEAQFCAQDSPLNEAIRLSHRPTNASQSGSYVGLGWHVRDDGQVIWHDGGTGGYTSFVGFRPTERTGVVVLCNTAVGVNALGMALLNMISGKEFKPPTYRTAVSLSAEQLEPYVGEYELEGHGPMSITRDGEKLYARLSLQPTIRIWPSSESEFFYRVVEAQITFERDEEGNVTSLVLHQNGRDMKAPRKS